MEHTTFEERFEGIIQMLKVEQLQLLNMVDEELIWKEIRNKYNKNINYYIEELSLLSFKISNTKLEIDKLKETISKIL